MTSCTLVSVVTGDSGRKEAESLFEFFQEKDDDLHKSYNDRSYISSEDSSNRDSASGEPPHTHTHTPSHTPVRLSPSHQSVLCRFRGAADGRDGLLAAELQRRRSGAIHAHAHQPDLLHHLPEVKHTHTHTRAHAAQTRLSRPPSLTVSVCLCLRMNRPSVVTFLDSDGNTAFEFRVPRVDTDMVRI